MKRETKRSHPWATYLTLIFVILKLCRVIDWSWWWVLSPAWIVLLILGAGMLWYINIK